MRVVYEQDVSGRSVVDAAGQVIGVVDALLVDTEGPRIDALRVRLGKSVADQIGAPYSVLRAARIDVPIDFVQSISDTVVLKGPVGALRTFVEAKEAQPAP